MEGVFCFVLHRSLRCPQRSKRRFTGFLILAAIPFTGQPHPSSSEKCFIATSHESLSSVRADATRAPEGLPVSTQAPGLTPLLFFPTEQERKGGLLR